MDIFLCTSPEYFYTFRAEYFLKGKSSNVLERFTFAITQELVHTIIAQLPPRGDKPFYISEQLAYIYDFSLGGVGGEGVIEPLYFSYTPALPLLFNSAAMYLPMTFL